MLGSMIAQGGEAELYEWGPLRVLKLYRRGTSARAVDAEWRALEVLSAGASIAPRAFERVELDGRAGIVLERLDGVDLLTQLGRAPWMLRQIGLAMGRIHAQLNGVEAPPQLPTLKHRLRVQLEACNMPEAPTAISRLDDLPDGDRLCHGDLHPANLIGSTRGELRVIDWSSATRGDPAADHAQSLLVLSLGAPPPGAGFVVERMHGLGRAALLRYYRRAYAAAVPVPDADIARWTPVLAAVRLSFGIPSERGPLLTLLERHVHP